MLYKQYLIIAKVMTKEVNPFKARQLSDKYVSIFMNTAYIPLRRKIVSKEAIIYVVASIKLTCLQ